MSTSGKLVIRAGGLGFSEDSSGAVPLGLGNLKFK